MIERGHPQVSLSRQCELLKLSRSSVYYVPREQCQEDLDLMYLIDQQHLETWLRRYNQAFQIGQASAGRSFRYSAIECSGSMIPDTNVGGNIATINEVSDDQKATFFFS